MKKVTYFLALNLLFTLFTITSCTTDDIEEDLNVYQKIIAEGGDDENPSKPPLPPTPNS